jgi:hypothetical protein
MGILASFDQRLQVIETAIFNPESFYTVKEILACKIATIRETMETYELEEILHSDNAGESLNRIEKMISEIESQIAYKTGDRVRLQWYGDGAVPKALNLTMATVKGVTSKGNLYVQADSEIEHTRLICPARHIRR